MGHLIDSKEQVYRALADRLNKNPVGAPVNEVLMDILHRLYTESEALVGSKFPLLPMTLDKISGITGVGENELKKLLDGMADKGLVLDLSRRDQTYYMLAPMVVGFFEYTFMRVRDDINMRDLAELFQLYFSNEDVRNEFFGGETKLMRGLVYESLIPAAVETEVLNYEKASEIIRQSGGGALSMCPCRHKASHLGKACGAPVEDVCTSLGGAASWLVSRGMARAATVDELLSVLDRTEKIGLVHLGDNVINNPTFICHCCGCCCVALGSIRAGGGKSGVLPSNFIPSLVKDQCMGCGSCAEACPIGALVVSGTADNGEEVPVINKDLCIGCGVCASSCPTGSLTMSRRSALHLPPQDKKEMFLRIAREKGRI